MRRKLLPLFATVAATGGCPSADPVTTATPITQTDASTDVVGVAEADSAECLSDGCLRSVVHVGDYSQAYLKPYLSPGVSIENGYSVYLLEFWSDGAAARAVATVPYEVSTPAGGWHIVANSHGTSGLDDACQVVGTIAGTGLAGLFGARGMIGIAPEYPGLGTPGIHPYLVKQSEGRAVLNALRATRRFAKGAGLAISDRFALVGMSQGGHATLSAASLAADYAPDLDIRAFAVAAPASAWEEHWRQGVAIDGEHLMYHAMLVYSWASTYGYTGPSLWASELTARIDGIMKTDCAWSPVGGPLLSKSLSTRASDIFSTGFLTAYRSGAWGDYKQFHTWFLANRIVPFRQTAPLRIYQGDADTTVPESATKALVGALREGGVEVDYQVVAGGGHLNVAFGFVASAELRTVESVAYVRALLDR